MKKLMTMLAAAAMAFGLYADTTPYEQSESFESGFTVSGLWSTNAADTATVEVQTYAEDAAPAPDIIPDAFNHTAGTKYLQVKTGMNLAATNGLAYNFGDKENDEIKPIGDGVYFDGLVNFTTACDSTEVDVTIDEDGGCDVKLVAYAVDMGEIEGGTAGQTNLFVTAGYYNASSWEAKAYDCGPLATYGRDESGFTRLTIRAIADISSSKAGVPGFVVFVNGYPASTEAAIGYTTLDATAAYWNSKGNLFPSLNQDAGSGTSDVIAGVTVAGQGLIDCFALTRTCPACAKDKSFTLTRDAHITSFKYQVGAGAVSEAITAESVDIPLTGAEMTVTISDIVYEQDAYIVWGEGNWEGTPEDVVTPNATAKTFTIAANAENCTGKMVSKDVAERIEMGGVYYQTFAQVIDAIGSSTAPVTLKIKQLVNVEKSGEFSAANFPATSDVTIDLNGQTITGTDFTGYVLTSAGKLTIIDSKPDDIDGSIVAVTGNAGAVQAANLTVTGGIFEGAVVATTSSEISGGSFLKGDEQEFPLTLADGYAATLVNNYWVVEAIPTYTLTITPNANADYTLTVDGESVTPDNDTISATNGAKVVLTATAKTGYEYDNGAATKVVNYTMKSDLGQTLEVPAPTAAKYYVFYSDRDNVGEPLHTNEFTVANYNELTLWDGARDGFTFNKDWQNSEGDDVDSDEKLRALFNPTAPANISLSGTWTPEATDVTVTLTAGNNIATIKDENDKDIASVTGEPGTEVTVTLAAVSTIKIPVFKAGDTQCGAVYVITIPDEDTTITFSAVDAADPGADPAEAKKALEDKGVLPATTAKFPDATVKALAAWMEGKGATAEVSDINQSDFVQASVALDVELIDEETEVEITELTEVSGGAMTFKIAVGATAMETEAQLNAIKDMVKATDDLTDTDWDLAVTATANTTTQTVTVTPEDKTLTQAFMKVVIPQDVTPTE